MHSCVIDWRLFRQLASGNIKIIILLAGYAKLAICLIESLITLSLSLTFSLSSTLIFFFFFCLNSNYSAYNRSVTVHLPNIYDLYHMSIMPSLNYKVINYSHTALLYISLRISIYYICYPHIYIYMHTSVCESITDWLSVTVASNNIYINMASIREDMHVLECFEYNIYIYIRVNHAHTINLHHLSPLLIMHVKNKRSIYIRWIYIYNQIYLVNYIQHFINIRYR